MKYKNLSKYEKLKLVGVSIKAATGVIGGSLVISEGHPYIALCVLALGAIANEVISFLKERETQYTNKPNGTEDIPTN